MISQLFAQEPHFQSLKMIAELFCQEYPPLKLIPFGHSVLGRELYAFSLGECRGASLMVGGVDGQDAPATLLLLRFCERLIFALKEKNPLCDMDVSRILERRGLLLVPCLNPDGISIAFQGSSAALSQSKQVEYWLNFSSPWQANANGVQLSHNFDAGWEDSLSQQEQTGNIVPASSGFYGRFPFDQPETFALAQLCSAFSPHRCYTFSSGNSALEYGYGNYTPPACSLMAGVMAASCGYPVIPLTPQHSHATLKAWMTEAFSCPAFQIFIQSDSGVQPYPKLEEMLLLALTI